MSIVERSRLNQLVSNITITTAPRIVATLQRNIKDPTRKRGLRDVIQNFVHGYCSSHDCGTSIAHAVGYNIIDESK